ncbi:hypothetical protein QLQ85_16320 [Halomonas sp. M4R5S39]|uniref:hypothetical protein n=1 Tax=Halomonas kalidii TaxID=3043293 RepID=UPI0024A91351|nr:hypothetical protein [Halomonas kalidii]MDI5986361.1 hypothetical protein [Halomonas kalidii]
MLDLPSFFETRDGRDDCVKAAGLAMLASLFAAQSMHSVVTPERRKTDKNIMYRL